ncbi:hypothetical protein [Vibrio chagasii]|uniref:hypothetical protein n=1 Tax=Vibrio chagasii TaxID=170679 RepID=UPI0022840076|nr:hypothetical protein [Vibrio chagasii]MCY9828804.1 hypothetical protein [Vibrio chagasii]
MHKKLSILVVITLLFMISGCVSDKFSQEVKLNLKSSDYESTFARFKVFDASEGCPSYNDLPGASAYIGKAKVSMTGTMMSLPANKELHIFYFKPSETPAILAKGGANEIRRRSVQIVLVDGEAELQLVKDENGEMKWLAKGSIQLEPATNCTQKKDEKL